MFKRLERNVRIVGGKYRGRAIVSPKGQNTRPTTDRVRESLFNILAHNEDLPDIEGLRVIDLFAGSGALGFEALSRGASFCLFVETDAAARGAIRENVEYFQAFGVTRIHRRSALDLGSKPAGLGPGFDLAFLDPPYQKDMVGPALKQLTRGGWLSDNALAVVETAEDEVLELADWELLDDRVYGETRVRLFKST